MYDRIIMHIDVNSAYLSWEAVHALENGLPIDYRTIPSVVGGDPKTRHGIVLAKSIPAKKYNILTGETLLSALKKCPTLKILKPSYDLYLKNSNALKSVIKNYTPTIQRFSVDEFFADFSGFSKTYGCPYTFALRLKEEIYQRLGFTVNIGVSTNKLLAKIAGDFEKPNKVHTLFKDELKSKLWPLPIGRLYMVGRKTEPKLRAMGINTIGDLAMADPDFIEYKLKKYGSMLQAFANGIEDSLLHQNDNFSPKGIGNSTTTSYDITSKEEAHMVLLSLTEMVCYRLRDIKKMATLVEVGVKNDKLSHYTHQKKLNYATDHTNEIYNMVKFLFDESWDGTPIRHLGVRVSGFKTEDNYQYSLFEYGNINKRRALDATIDKLRECYGQKIIMRGCFSHSHLSSFKGGTMNHLEFPAMKSQL